MVMTMRHALVSTTAVLVMVALSQAQTPPPAAPSQAPAQAAAPTGKGPGPARGFDYSPEGRRDPFVSLIGRGAAADRGPQAPRGNGLASLETAEVALKGTMLSSSGPVAMLEGSDGRTYIVRAGDKLRDGAVRAISQNALVIVQQVNDPLSSEKQREVRKTIRQTDEAK
jgi:type IV pilus assembly protein PilP